MDALGRWSGPFANANVAGLELVSLIIVVLVSARLLEDALAARWQPIAVIGSAMCVLLLVGGLVATGSRAALLELLVGLCVLKLRACLRWWHTWVIAASLITCMCTDPHLAARLQDLPHDGSVLHRSAMWRATLACIGDHPWHGCGSEACPDIISVWYLPWTMEGAYRTALNDVLTWSAIDGIAATVAITVTIGLLLSLTVGLRARDPHAVAILLAVSVCHVVAGGFQAMSFYAVPRWVLLCCLAAIAVCAVRSRLDNPGSRRASIAAAGVLIGLAMTMSVGALACYERNHSDVRTVLIGPAVVAEPRGQPERQVCLLLLTNQSRWTSAVRQRWAEPLLHGGWPVVVPTTASPEAEDTLIGALARAGRSVVVMAWGQRIDDIRSLHAHVSGIILLDPQASPELAAAAPQPRLILASTFGAFSPDPDDLRRHASASTTLDLERGWSVSPAWAIPRVSRWLSDLSPPTATSNGDLQPRPPTATSDAAAAAGLDR